MGETIVIGFLHKLFPHHIPIMTDWVYEITVKGNTELLRESMAAKYYALAIEVKKEEEN